MWWSRHQHEWVEERKQMYFRVPERLFPLVTEREPPPQVQLLWHIVRTCACGESDVQLAEHPRRK